MQRRSSSLPANNYLERNIMHVFTLFPTNCKPNWGKMLLYPRKFQQILLKQPPLQIHLPVAY